MGHLQGQGAHYDAANGSTSGEEETAVAVGAGGAARVQPDESAEAANTSAADSAFDREAMLRKVGGQRAKKATTRTAPAKVPGKADKGKKVRQYGPVLLMFNTELPQWRVLCGCHSVCPK
jgi:hypothetical protein